jgi:RNA polymerase sigma-70 factor (ECF subfamily)
LSFQLKHDEVILLKRLAEGDAGAFAIIYNRYYTSIMLFTQHFLSPVQSEDIVAEAFIKLWQSAASFERMPQVYQWLRVTVRNASLNLLRRQKNINKKQNDFLHLTEQEYEQRYFIDELSDDLHTRIMAAIENLPPRQQEILKMYFVEEMNNVAIADKLQISIQAVKNQKVTALKALRRIFTREDLALYSCCLSVLLSLCR